MRSILDHMGTMKEPWVGVGRGPSDCFDKVAGLTLNLFAYHLDFLWVVVESGSPAYIGLVLRLMVTPGLSSRKTDDAMGQ